MVRDWLDDFLFRLAESYPPQDWPEGGTDEWRRYVEDWVAVLALNQVKPEEADAARMALLETPPRFKVDYIPGVIGAVKALREGGKAKGVPADVPLPVPDPRTIDASRDCPECTRERGRLRDVGPTGWARRAAMWHSIPRPIVVELFCRCPLGRWRLAHDVELMRGERVRQHDDLQARPELWDLEANHPSWSWRSVEHDLVMPAGTEGKWWYLSTGEVAPEPIRPSALAGRISDDFRPSERKARPEWMGRIPDDIPMPKPVPREPRPEVEPAPEPVTEEEAR